MNFLLRILALGGLLAATHGFALEAFEGKVSLALSSGNGQPQTMDYTMKGKKLRMDITVEKSATSDESSPKKSHRMLPGFLGGKKAASDESESSDTGSSKNQQVSTIMDMEKMEMLMLMPEQNMYMVMPIKKPAEKALEKQGESTAEIERTGKTEKILGYTCDQILVTDKEKKTVTELWVASDLGMFGGLGGGNQGGGGGMFGGRKGGGGGAAAAKWEEVLKGKGGFPLRVVSHDLKGKETFRMEATKIEPGPQPDSLFLPPEGYKKFSMPDFGGMNPFKQG